MLLDEIAGYLIAGNVASSSGSGSPEWYLSRGRMPDGPGADNRMVALIETGGPPPLFPVNVHVPTFQVIVRGAPMVDVSTAYEEARQKAHDIQSRLHGVKDETLTGVRYVLIMAEQEPFWSGDDANERPVFPCNYTAWKEST